MYFSFWAAILMSLVRKPDCLSSVGVWVDEMEPNNACINFFGCGQTWGCRRNKGFYFGLFIWNLCLCLESENISDRSLIEKKLKIVKIVSHSSLSSISSKHKLHRLEPHVNEKARFRIDHAGYIKIFRKFSIVTILFVLKT